MSFEIMCTVHGGLSLSLGITIYNCLAIMGCVCRYRKSERAGPVPQCLPRASQVEHGHLSRHQRSKMAGKHDGLQSYRTGSSYSRTGEAWYPELFSEQAFQKIAFSEQPDNIAFFINVNELRGRMSGQTGHASYLASNRNNKSRASGYLDLADMQLEIVRRA